MTATEGQYVYTLNGAPAPVQETWRVVDESGNLVQLESSRRAPGFELCVSATLAEGEVRDCTLSWKSEELGEVQAEYQCLEQGIEFRRHGSEDIQLLAHPPGGSIILYPLMRIFTGGVIRAVARRGGAAQVLVPFIGDPGDYDRLLTPDLSQREARRLADGDDCSGDCWQFVGGQYDEAARFWLGRGDTLSRYCWRQDESSAWDIRLERGR